MHADVRASRMLLLMLPPVLAVKLPQVHARARAPLVVTRVRESRARAHTRGPQISRLITRLTEDAGVNAGHDGVPSRREDDD